MPLNLPLSTAQHYRQTGTQIQIKLGRNIDVVMASQFLTNSLDFTLITNKSLKERVKKALNVCVRQDQRAQDRNGSMAGSG